MTLKHQSLYRKHRLSKNPLPPHFLSRRYRVVEVAITPGFSILVTDPWAVLCDEIYDHSHPEKIITMIAGTYADKASAERHRRSAVAYQRPGTESKQSL